MPVLYFLLVVVVIVLGAAAVALYLAYIVCAAALAALCALAVYGAGLPIAYLVSLGEVLIVRSSSLAAPGWWPEPPENADPAVLEHFHGPSPGRCGACCWSRPGPRPRPVAFRLAQGPVVLWC